MKDFRELKVWQKAHALALSMYAITRTFPSDERFGLTAQVKSAASSVPANIAEGCGRGSDADLRRFLYMSMGSASELEYHLLLSKDLGFIGEAAHVTSTQDAQEVKRMLAALIARLGEPSKPRGGES